MVTYNSQGLVRKTDSDSLNSSQANLISQPVSDCSLELSQWSNSILRPSLANEMLLRSESPK